MWFRAATQAYGNGFERRERPSSSKSTKQRLRTSARHGWFLQPKRKLRIDKEEPNEAVLQHSHSSQEPWGEGQTEFLAVPKHGLKGGVIIGAMLGREAILGKNCVLQGPEPRASLYPISYFMQTCSKLASDGMGPSDQLKQLTSCKSTRNFFFPGSHIQKKKKTPAKPHVFLKAY